MTTPCLWRSGAPARRPAARHPTRRRPRRAARSLRAARGSSVGLAGADLPGGVRSEAGGRGAWADATSCTPRTSAGLAGISTPTASRATSASCSTATGAGPGPAGRPSEATRPGPTRSRSCSTGARRPASRSSPCGCCRPTTSTAPEEELRPLLRDHRDGRRRRSPTTRPWRLNPVGALDLLPAETAARAQGAPTSAPTTSTGCIVNVAVGYGGRREIADAVRSLLAEHARRGTTIEELAEMLDVEHIAEHLYTKGQPDPDLVIRTSGEQRLVGLPAVAERAQRVLLLRGLLARLPPGRLPARAARLRASATAASAAERCRGGPGAPGARQGRAPVGP